MLIHSIFLFPANIQFISHFTVTVDYILSVVIILLVVSWRLEISYKGEDLVCTLLSETLR